MGNKWKEPAKNFRFVLRVEAKYDIPLRSVQAFQRENEYEYIQEGGLNDYVHILRKPVSKPSTLEIERYVGTYSSEAGKQSEITDTMDPLPNGKVLSMPLLLLVSEPSDNTFSEPRRTYAFTGCVVTAKDYGGLEAENSGLLTEKITIAYQELLVIDKTTAQ